MNEYNPWIDEYRFHLYGHDHFTLYERAYEVALRFYGIKDKDKLRVEAEFLGYSYQSRASTPAVGSVTEGPSLIQGDFKFWVHQDA